VTEEPEVEVLSAEDDMLEGSGAGWAADGWLATVTVEELLAPVPAVATFGTRAVLDVPSAEEAACALGGWTDSWGGATVELGAGLEATAPEGPAEAGAGASAAPAGLARVADTIHTATKRNAPRSSRFIHDREPRSCAGDWAASMGGVEDTRPAPGPGIDVHPDAAGMSRSSRPTIAPTLGSPFEWELPLAHDASHRAALPGIARHRERTRSPGAEILFRGKT
jgi:hypothetical protein